jgi:hypothetical protein
MQTKETPMTTRIDIDTAQELRNGLEEVREAWRTWTDRWSEFHRTLRHGGYDTYRLDAYGVGVGRDEGGGQSLEGWLDEIDTDLAKGATPSTCAGSDGRCYVHEGAWTSGERHCEDREF